MTIELREVTKENFDDCIRLNVSESQSGYVATNLMSIAQSRVFPDLNIRAVYEGEEMVGFAMYGLDPDEGKHYLVRLMVDAAKQGKGYGRQTTKKVIEEMRSTDGADALYLFCVPENEGARKLYESIGFVETGLVHDESGELEMRYDL